MMLLGPWFKFEQIETPCSAKDVVRVLLNAKAQISPDTGDGPQELRDAIDGCHVEALGNTERINIFLYVPSAGDAVGRIRLRKRHNVSFCFCVF